MGARAVSVVSLGPQTDALLLALISEGHQDARGEAVVSLCSVHLGGSFGGPNWYTISNDYSSNYVGFFTPLVTIYEQLIAFSLSSCVVHA